MALTESVKDRAREWVNEHHPDCTDETEYQALLAAAAAEIAAIDAQADRDGH